MTKDLLDINEWDIYERGIIQLKGKEKPMKTYWLFRKHSKYHTKNNKIHHENQLIVIDEMNSSYHVNEGNSPNLCVITNKLDDRSPKPLSQKRKKRCQIL